jgi:hypothetical protein
MRKDDFSYKNVDKMHVRLRRARLAAGFSTAIDAIKRFGWSVSTYRAHENGQNAFDALAAIRYARAFKVAPTWLLLGDEALGASGATAIGASLPDAAQIEAGLEAIIGARPAQIMDGRALRPASEAVVGLVSIPHDSRYPQVAQFVLVVEGESVNRVARDGDRLLCVDIDMLGLPPGQGDLVLIERNGAMGNETSIRRLRRIGRCIALSFDSTHADWRETMIFPEGTGLSAHGVRVLAKALFVFRRVDAAV